MVGIVAVLAAADAGRFELLEVLPDGVDAPALIRAVFSLIVAESTVFCLLKLLFCVGVWL